MSTNFLGQFNKLLRHTTNSHMFQYQNLRLHIRIPRYPDGYRIEKRPDIRYNPTLVVPNGVPDPTGGHVGGVPQEYRAVVPEITS